MPVPKKASPSFFFIVVVFPEYIFSDTWITEKKNSNNGKRNGNYSCHKSSFFSIYWNRKLAGSWNVVCICVFVCLWTSLSNVSSDIFLISVYIKKALHDFDFHNMKVKQFRIETIIFFRNWPMKMYLSWVWKTALQSSFPSKLAMTFQKQNVGTSSCGEFLDCFY